MKFHTLVCSMVLILNIGSTSDAQLPDAATVLETEKIERSIERLNREIQRTQNETTIKDTSSTPRDSFETITEGLDDRPRLKLRPKVTPDINTFNGIGNLTNTDDIFDRIELLKKINRDKSNPENRSPTSNPPLPEPIPPNVPNVDNLETLPTPMPASSEPSANSQPTPTTRPMATDRVLSEPVNAFEMGNSLFQTGHIATALDAYNAVDLETMSVFDATWLNFMKATCNRKLGNTNEASAAYRQISNERNSPHLVEASAWWLKHNEALNAVETNFEQIQRNIDSVADRIKNYENP